MSGLSPNWLRSIFIAPVRLYRATISRITPATCRFQPTCSAYCIDAIKERGVLVGIGLTLWRLVRCHPLCKGGLDPVLPASNGPAEGRPAPNTSPQPPASTHQAE